MEIFYSLPRGCGKSMLKEIICTTNGTSLGGPEEIKAALNALYGVSSASRSKIKRIIFNDPATIIIFDDGHKQVVKTSDDDFYDPMTGAVLCMLKELMGYSEYRKFLKRVYRGIKDDYFTECR